MSNQIQIFENKEFGKIRVVEIDGLTWFVGIDVAAALGYTNGSRDINRHVDEEDRKSTMIPQYQNGTLVSKATIINESGLYSLILSSKLPNATVFKRWVTSEVLPSIRKHGAYITEDTLVKMAQDQDYTAQLLEALIQSYGDNAALLEYAESLAPKARYYDTILQCTDAVQVSIIAKDYGMSAVAFNKMLHSLGVQYKVGNTWLLYKEHADKGYTVTKTYYIGDKVASIYTCWTQKGRFWLYDFLGWHGISPVIEKLREN